MLWSTITLFSLIRMQSAGTLSPWLRSTISPTTRSLMAIEVEFPLAPLYTITSWLLISSMILSFCFSFYKSQRAAIVVDKRTPE